MKQFLLKLWQNEEGAETAEWLVIVALLVAMGTVVYGDPGLEGTLADLVTYIGGIVPAAGP